MPLRLVRPHDGAISDASNADDEPARPDWDLSLDGSKVMDQGAAPLSEADARSLVLRILRADLDWLDDHVAARPQADHVDELRHHRDSIEKDGSAVAHD